MLAAHPDEVAARMMNCAVNILWARFSATSHEEIHREVCNRCVAAAWVPDRAAAAVATVAVAAFKCPNEKCVRVMLDLVYHISSSF